MSSNQDPKQIIKLLGLEPHPEGGYFKETFRDTPPIFSSTPNRGASSLIYFLIEQGNFSNLHRIDAAEVWHFYAGAGDGIEVVELEAEGPKITRLGMDLAAGQRPQYVVQKDRWFGARVASGWALVGCTVAPAFEFENFLLGKREVLLKKFPKCEDVILALTPES